MRTLPRTRQPTKTGIKMLTKTSAVLAAALLTGCASISGNKLQPLSVTTVHNNQEITGIGCTLTNDSGNWFVTSPGTATVHKSTGDLVIDCKRHDMVGNATVVSKSNTAVWGNILFGGGIGYIVDRNTGAGFDYPNTVAITMRPIGDRPAAPGAMTDSAAAK
ncbi:hypothetical protein [Massilia endophytica]|uniref:hypothetical protein n=1 Tax=Massilia endophytica TaxID=2899220 RepID=UPI001E5ECEB4|nr:hypothetical protein [Massilia endophytica]UGQ46390.1 hypothetical protein LSQ66_21920 [Massilia endophytica]